MTVGPPADGFVDSNGIRLHYVEWNAASAERPPLVMLHANGFLARLWQPVAERLAGRYHVFAFDTRGHGDSDRPDPADASNYHWRELAADLRGFLDALELRSVPVVGHSSGAAVASYLAATRPEYISRLVLIEPIIIPAGMRTRARGNEMAEAARRRREVWAGPGEMIEAYRGRPLFERWTEGSLRLYAEHGLFRREDGQFQLKCAGEVEARMFENSASLEIWEVLPQVLCPALVLKGQHTDPFLGQIVEEVSGRIPGGRAATVSAADHLVPMERPEELSRIVLDFLRETD